MWWRKGNILMSTVTLNRYKGNDLTMVHVIQYK